MAGDQQASLPLLSWWHIVPHTRHEVCAGVGADPGEKGVTYLWERTLGRRG